MLFGLIVWGWGVGLVLWRGRLVRFCGVLLFLCFGGLVRVVGGVGGFRIGRFWWLIVWFFVFFWVVCAVGCYFA